ncbi:hypothetical protein ACS0TY_014355 [Phlomoides rotata]
MKVVAMIESNDLSKITTFDLFSDLKAFEFDTDRRNDEDTSTSKVTALVAATAESNQAAESEDDKDELALFIKKFKKFEKGEGQHGRKPGHFIKDCPYPETKKYADDEKAVRSERNKKQDKKRTRTLLSELEKSKYDSPSSFKPLIESEDEDSSDSEDNEALICLMAKDEEKQTVDLQTVLNFKGK